MSRAGPNPFHRKPWSLKWIIAAIVVCVLPYTYLNLKYRKLGPAHQPYADNKARAVVLRLLDAGFQRLDAEVSRPMDPRAFSLAGPAAPLTPLPGGLPPILSEILIDKPLVPVAVTTVLAPAIATAGAPYTLQFSCTQPDHAEHFATATVYRRGEHLTFVPAYDALDGGLQSRFLESTVQLTLPTASLNPGEYHATLVGARTSQRWTFTLR